MLIYEVTTIKPQLPQTPAQARIAVLKQNVDRAQVAVKAERKRQQVQAAQKKLQRAAAAQIGRRYLSHYSPIGGFLENEVATQSLCPLQHLDDLYKV
jgi:hypothetical protein